mgnify:FL=1
MTTVKGQVIEIGPKHVNRTVNIYKYGLEMEREHYGNYMIFYKRGNKAYWKEFNPASLKAGIAYDTLEQDFEEYLANKLIGEGWVKNFVLSRTTRFSLDEIAQKVAGAFK